MSRCIAQFGTVEMMCCNNYDSFKPNGIPKLRIILQTTISIERKMRYK